jgi:type VI secretion system secreted protein Hcp
MNLTVKKYPLITMILLVLLLTTSSNSIAAASFYLKLTGIPGESVKIGHGNEIDILAWAWGVTQTGNAIAGAGKPDAQNITFTKYIDKSSPLLLTSCITGNIIPSAVLTVQSASASPIEFLKINLTNVMVASISSGGSGGQDRLTEDISFSFEQLQFVYTPQKADGTAGTPISSIYNYKTGL